MFGMTEKKEMKTLIIEPVTEHVTKVMIFVLMVMT